MRIWKLEDLFNEIHKRLPKAKNYCRLFHVCIICGWRTPELAPLDCMIREIPKHASHDFEIKNNGVCDKCNDIFWKEMRNYFEHKTNHCEPCGGGRCYLYNSDSKWPVIMFTGHLESEL